MNVRQDAAAPQPTKRARLTKRAALSVAAAAVIGGAAFAPSAVANTGPSSSEQRTTAGCGDCYPDVI
ncbi:hypothetical protein ACIGJO_13785 [Streptomyces sp. NPDC079020]|uniref:hypothetical protein n=1 Tax=Streptomyces sp. NPDC079020 TaxID=3365722 RepID=UPI0037D8284B